MVTYTVVIVEDEKLTRERISSLLSQYPDFQLIAEATNGLEALTAIKRHKPDVVFLDIKIPILSGFEVLKKMDSDTFKVLVCITAYDEYALEAFEHEAIDYLLKPFDKDRFDKLMKRIPKYLNLPEHNQNKFVLAKEQGEIIRIPLDEIVYIKSDNNYVIIHLEHTQHKKRTSLSNLERTLGASFFRIHRSFIINENKILKMKHIRHGEYFFLMANGKLIPSSKSYRKEVKILTR